MASHLDTAVPSTSALGLVLQRQRHPLIWGSGIEAVSEKTLVQEIKAWGAVKGTGGTTISIAIRTRI